MSPYFDTGPYGFRCGARSTLPSLPIDGSLGRDSSEFPSSCGKQNGTSDFDSLHMWVHAEEADPETSQCFLVAFQNHARRVLFFGHTHNVNIQPESAHSRSTPAHTHTRTRNHTHTHICSASRTIEFGHSCGTREDLRFLCATGKLCRCLEARENKGKVVTQPDVLGLDSTCICACVC